MNRSRGSWLLVLSAAALMVACDDGGDGAGEGADAGADGVSADYYSGALSASLGAEGNEATCSTCHSNNGDQVGYSGKSFKNIAHRASFKGGDAPTLLDGSNACVTGWMGGTALTADDASWASLEAYLMSISDPMVTEPNPIAPEVLADEAAYEAIYTGGDPAAGAAAYARACSRCHSAELKVGELGAYPLEVLATYTAGRIAQQVRTSGPPPSGMADESDTTPGPMPFFEESDVSTQDLTDIIAYITNQS